MFHDRLLERIGSLERHAAYRANDSTALQVRSIISHLRKLLNTRQGSACIAEDYGIPDLTDLLGEGVSQAIRQVEQSLQQTIAKYEPRLSSVRVSLDSGRESDPLSRKFRVEGRLADPKNYPIIFETVIGSDGKVDVTVD
jgi:type VI secretion system protein